MASKHAGCNAPGAAKRKKESYYNAQVFGFCKQEVPAKSHLRRRRFSATDIYHMLKARNIHQDLGSGYLTSVLPKSREAVGKRRKLAASTLQPIAKGGLKGKKKGRKNQLPYLKCCFFLGQATEDNPSATVEAVWIDSRSLSSGSALRRPWLECRSRA